MLLVVSFWTDKMVEAMAMGLPPGRLRGPSILAHAEGLSMADRTPSNVYFVTCHMQCLTKKNFKRRVIGTFRSAAISSRRDS